MGWMTLLLLTMMASPFGATSVVSPQPLVWLGSSLVRSSVPVAVGFFLMRSSPAPASPPAAPLLSGPVGVIRRVPAPSAAPPSP